MIKKFQWKLPSVLALATVLMACGGGDGDPPVPPARAIQSMVVVGDSLSDSGTFYAGPGTMRSFTVQGSEDEPNVLWVERIAAAHGLPPLCAAYQFTDEGFAPGAAGCRNHAVGGARIQNPIGDGQAPQLPILHQLHDAAAAGWSPATLLALDGGSNDAADLIKAYLEAPADGGAEFRALVAAMLPPSSDAGSESSMARAGVDYMRALAGELADSVVDTALDRGVDHVVIANIPAITLTPQFETTLARIEAEQGPHERAQAEALFEQWVNAFNSHLATRFADDTRVIVIDIASQFRDLVANPGNYDLSNVTVPLCGVNSITLYSWDECTAEALTPWTPDGAPANWWQRYLFADGFHPTPYGHRLMAEQVLEAMANAGWNAAPERLQQAAHAVR